MDYLKKVSCKMVLIIELSVWVLQMK